MNKEILNYLETADTVIGMALLTIFSKGITTGSKVFGGWEEGHDIDIILPPTVHEHLFEGSLCYTSAEYNEYNEAEFRSFYVKDKYGNIYNLLFTDDEYAYNKWVYATKRMLETGKDYSDKAVRVEEFEKFKRLYDER